MNQMVKKVEISILGQNYSLLSEADDEYIRELAEYVNEKLEEVKNKAKAQTTTRIAVIAALNIADELFKLSSNHEVLKNNVRETCGHVLDKIEKRIEDCKE